MFGEIFGTVLGGLLGGSGADNKQTSNQIDPRLAKYIYGENGNAGLLGDVQKLYQQQMGQGGLNDMQRAGLESQRQVLTSPQFSQGYDAMRSMGLGLMGAGVAQNPFASGRMGGGQTPSVVRPNVSTQYQPFAYQPNQALMAATNPIQSVAQYQGETPKAPDPQTVDQIIDEYMKANQLGKYQWADSVADGAGQ